MLELTNSTALTLAAGETAIFDTVRYHFGGDTCTKAGTGSIKMRCNAVYEVRFTGNIATADAAGTAQLAIETGGVVDPAGTILSQTATAGAANAVERTLYEVNCCGDYSRVTVVNTGTVPVLIEPGAVLSVRKVG